MRHKVSGRKFGLEKGHRDLMLKNSFRKGDCAPMVIIEFVGNEEASKEAAKSSKKK